MSKILIALLCLSATICYADSFEDLASQAGAARQANDIGRATELYKEAVNLKPDWAQGWWFLGSFAYDADQYPAGEEALSHFVQLEEKVAPGWALLGLCEFETGHRDESLEHIRRALQLNSGLPEQMIAALRFHEAQLLTRAGLFDQAMEKYVPFSHQGDQGPEMASAIGLAALRTPLLVKEIPAGRQELFIAAGGCVNLWMANQFPQTDEAFQALIQRFPNLPNVHYLYGSYLYSSRPEQAAVEFKREVEINPDSVEALAMLAQECVHEHDMTTALGFAQKAAEKGRSIPLAQYVYGLILARTGDANRGIPYLETAEKLDPANLEYHMALASAYSKAGRMEQARRERAESVVIAKGGDANAR